FQATLADPPDSQAAKDTVDRVRAAVHAVPNADAKVGGSTAVILDAGRAAANDNRTIIPLVLGVVLVILAVLLRAVTAPLVLIATVVLSYAAALGISAFFFEHVFHFEGQDNAFPLFVFVFLVALGIDYNIFLMTRVREESAQLGTRQGAVAGLAATGGVITSAGLILASTFAVLGTLPVVGFAEIGFAVALGVLLDTLVVRSVLVTALTMDLDRHMWWPNKLSRQVHDPESQLSRHL
ncbi:MMPL family transporter, partial [Kitasatospora sp. NPDC058263]